MNNNGDVEEHFPPELGRLAVIPRVKLFAGPTPLQTMPHLAKVCGGQAELYVKRDDCTELAFGGNKVRQLEYYFGEAVAQSADTVLITGAVQSNFVRLAAAAAARLGMACHIQLEERVPKNDPIYRTSGNVLLDEMLGATMHHYPDGEDEAGADRQLSVIADELRSTGSRPYIIPLAPGHAPIGALGYVVAAHELLEQLAREEIELDEIVVASGSGATHAGLLFGLRALGCEIPVTGICVRRDAIKQRPRLIERCQEIAELLDIDNMVADEDIVLRDDFLAPGYGKSGEVAMRAILLGARTEGLMLDPTYTGKTMAGFIDRAETATEPARLLFFHTGGSPAIFAYQNELKDAMTPDAV